MKTEERGNEETSEKGMLAIFVREREEKEVEPAFSCKIISRCNCRKGNFKLQRHDALRE